MRSHNLHFIPRSFSFSELDETMVENLSYEDEEPQDKETILLETIHNVKNDKQRVVFLLEVLREYGYQMDCESISRAMGIQRRWYQRIKQAMRTVVSRVI